MCPCKITGCIHIGSDSCFWLLVRQGGEKAKGNNCCLGLCVPARSQGEFILEATAVSGCWCVQERKGKRQQQVFGGSVRERKGKRCNRVLRLFLGCGDFKRHQLLFGGFSEYGNKCCSEVLRKQLLFLAARTLEGAREDTGRLGCREVISSS